MIVSGEAVAAYVAARIGKDIVEPYTALGVMDGGRVVAGVVFNGWTGPDIEITVANEPGRLTRGFLRRLARYAWDEAGAARVSITTESARVVDLAIRLGGTVEGIKRDAFGLGRDAVMLGILKKDWRI